MFIGSTKYVTFMSGHQVQEQMEIADIEVSSMHT